MKSYISVRQVQARQITDIRGFELVFDDGSTERIAPMLFLRWEPAVGDYLVEPSSDQKPQYDVVRRLTFEAEFQPVDTTACDNPAPDSDAGLKPASGVLSPAFDEPDMFDAGVPVG